MPGSHDFDPAEIEATLRDLELLLLDPNNAARTLYTEDAILVAGGPPARGREELLAREGVLPLHDAVIRPESIIGVAGLASVFGHFSCSILDPEAGRVEVSCHFLMVLRKESDGVWRVARECLVDDSATG
jgi:ketosteroid isomerase-like protein